MLCALGCEAQERKSAFATRERSQAVQSTAAAPESASTAAVPVRASAEARPKPRRTLCGALEDGKPLPRKKLSQAAAEAAPPLPDSLSATKTGWTWVNFWAAWCAPCKEEIPRLRSWEKKLNAGPSRLAVKFVSLDDDERQLRGFLESSSDLRSTYWLKEGTERDEWMIAAGLSPDPELPIHLLVDSQGKIRCKVQGAVEDSDFPELLRALGG
jgi:thiol-disulfide isomerase/thioredoxin